MTKQFRDETREQQLKLFTAWLDGEVIDARYHDGPWLRSYTPGWYMEHEYRIKPTADTVPWDAIHEDYQWYARDKNGIAYVSKYIPTMGGSYWCARVAQETNGVFTGHKIGTCDWKDSLQERPKS